MASIGVHVIGWILFFILIIAFAYSSNGSIFHFDNIFYPSLLLFFTIYILFFYFNTTILFPKLYLQKKYAAYVLILLIFFVLIFYLQPFDRLIARHYNFSMGDRPPFHRGQNLPPPAGPLRDQHLDIVSIVLFLMIISLSTVGSLVKQWRQSEKKAAQAETEKAQAELSFLKAQINPHFLFNTLNNIYALTVTKNEQAPEAVMKLSNIMRYVTDEVFEDYVPLEKEVACARNYIDLQQLRLNKKTQIDFKVEGALEGRKIAPLIFISFIENAFKYGISSHEVSAITICITAGEKAITLFCRNQVFPNLKSWERTGIGLANTKRRLEYLYPNKHLLSTTQENGLYTVQLTVQA